MARVKTTNRTNSVRSGKRHHGFTLVELIVVLAILAILAAAGVFAAVGYINRSRFDQNSQNAITVYQTAQTALAQRKENGTIEDWVFSVAGANAGFSETELDELKNVNDAIHKTIALTYNPGINDNELYNLLSSYFYDPSVFRGTISVVFDISATKNDDGIEYSANALGAFYSKENATTSGWDPYYIHSSTSYNPGNTDEDPWKQLPWRDYDFRRSDSRVGYYDGSAQSLLGQVVLPGHDDPNDMIFTMSNGETLDVTWALFDPKLQNKDIIISFSDADSNAEDFVKLKLKSSGLQFFNIDSKNLSENVSWDYKDLSGYENLNNVGGYANTINNVYYSSRNIVYESVTIDDNIPSFSIKKESIEGFVSVEVTRGDDTQDMIFPITITKVTGDRTLGRPESGEYISFTLSLDCMQTRSDYNSYLNNRESSDLFWSDRLFGQNPLNVSAKMTISGYNSIPALRANDDPMFSTGVDAVKDNGSFYPRYCYDINSAKAKNDTVDNCVVNTLFGDLECNLDGSSIGSFSGTSGGNAVITSFRHLSNARQIPGSESVEFIIAKDLDWYNTYEFTDSSSGTDYKLYYSEVKVYTNWVTENWNSRRDIHYAYDRNAYRHHSPVENGSLKIVSFPALSVLASNHTLTSMMRSNNESYSINNVQLRKASFINSVDTGYGFICENDGSVYNLTINNLSLVIYEVKDGEDNDYSGTDYRRSICPASEATIREAKSVVDTVSTRLNDAPIGGLIGLNKGNAGLIGIDDEKNTIQMNNTIVMAGDYWMIYWHSKGVGGVIGSNEGNTNGVLEINGTFAVLGQNRVGGIIGYSNQAVNSSLMVNNPNATVPASEFELPVESHTGKKMTCVIASKFNCGGAIGEIKDTSFDYIPDGQRFTSSGVNQTTGEITFDGPYQIQVNLPEDSLVLLVCDLHAGRNGGGAIGHVTNCSGYLSIDIHNEGIVALEEIDREQGRCHCGGAIGYDDVNSMDLFIKIDNTETSRIGSYIDTEDTERLPDTVGGAVGYTNNQKADRTVAVRGSNAGDIRSRGCGTNNSNYVACGAGGAWGGFYSTIDLKGMYIDVKNSGNIVDVPLTDNYDYDGAGGAIGRLYGKNNSWNAASFIRVENHGTIEAKRYVGGAIGYSRMITGTTIVSTNGTISGINYIGGAIGYNESQAGTINSSVYGNGKIIASENYSAGAIGYNHGVISGGVIVSLESAYIEGKSFTAGAIGYNNEDIAGDIVVNISTSKIYGEENTGGAIGRNEPRTNGRPFTIKSKIVVDISNSEIKGTNRTGGVIGSSDEGVDGSIEVKISDSSIIGKNRTGGVVGSNSSSSNFIRGPIDVEIAGDSLISGDDYTGGAFGYNESSLGPIDIDIKGSSSIEGKQYTAGAIGLNQHELYETIVNFEDTSRITGTDYIGGVFGEADFGEYGSISFKCSGNRGTEPLIIGGKYVGGVIGVVGNSYNINGSINIIDADINVAVLIKQSENAVAGDECAYIGGLIGLVSEPWTISSINLHGEGSYLISAGGSCVGGLIGQIGIEGTNVAVRIPVIDTSDSPKINVESTTDGSSGIGGWIGKSYSSWAGVGEPTATSTSAFNVTNVSSVTSNADDVGAFIGGIYGPDSGNNIYANIEVALNTVTVTGNDNVGGLVGYMNKVSYMHLTSLSMTYLTIEGNNNVGGLIGHIDNCSTSEDLIPDSFHITSNINVDGSGDNVGGFIGKLVSNSDFYFGNLVITSADVFNVGGDDNVGGVIGNADLNGNTMYGKLSLTVQNSTIGDGTGNDIGGVVGNWLNGHLTGGVHIGLSSSSVKGMNDVAGAIGNWHEGNLSGGVSAVVSGSDINGYENTAGAIGIWNEGDITGGVSSYYTNSSINASGDESAGAIGEWSSGSLNGGLDVSFTNSQITGGESNVAGAIGLWTSGDFEGGITSVFDRSSVEASGDDVGGVIGEWADGTFNGGITAEFINSVVSSEGNDVAGVIGHWSAGYLYGGIVVNSKASDSGFSVSGTSKVAGVIGELEGGYIGGEVDSSGTIVRAGAEITLSKSTVTGLEEVGGAIGIMNGGVLSGGITVNLKDHSYIGDIPTDAESSWKCIDVGGAVGFVGGYEGCFEANSGRVVVTIDETSMIFAGGTGDGNDVTIEHAGVGGAFGRLGESGKNRIPYVNTWDKNNDANLDNKFSSLDNSSDYKANIEVMCESSNVAVESRASTVGGMVGYMYSGIIVRSFSTAVVKGTNYVGGVIGRFAGGRLAQCYSGGHTVGGQYMTCAENVSGDNFVGGFAGYVDKTAEDIYQSYSTTSVCGKSNVGGFIGYNDYRGNYTCNQCYCTGLVTKASGGDDRTIGAFTGYAANQGCCSTTSNGNKVLRFVNANMRRVGSVGTNTADGNMPENRVRWAYWGAPPNNNNANYIRINKDSLYDAHPFDSTLDPMHESFPLRTFISYKNKNNNNKWVGCHYGDWPMVMTEDTKLLSNDNTKIYFVDDNGNTIGDVFTYSINGVCPKVKVVYTDGMGVETVLTPESGYITISYVNNDRIGNSATVQVAGNGTDYGRAVSRTFTIEAWDISSASVTISEQTYTGEAIKPDITVALDDGVNYLIIPASDYTVESYTDNVNVGTATVKIKPDASKYIVTGSDDGMLTGTFEIKPVEITDENTEIVLTGDPITFTGMKVVPTIDSVTVTSGEKAFVLSVDDYDVDSSDDSINAGPGTLTITGKGNFTGSKSMPFTIAMADNAWITEPSIADWTEGEDASQPEIGESKFGGDTREITYYSDEACADEDKVDDITTAAAGTYYMKVVVPADDSGNGNYGELVKIVEFEIKAVAGETDPAQGGSGSAGTGGTEGNGESEGNGGTNDSQNPEGTNGTPDPNANSNEPQGNEGGNDTTQPNDSEVPNSNGGEPEGNNTTEQPDEDLPPSMDPQNDEEQDNG